MLKLMCKLSVFFFLELCKLGSKFIKPCDRLVYTEYEHSDPATEVLRPIVFQFKILCKMSSIRYTRKVNAL
jgi:hypothetical protein